MLLSRTRAESVEPVAIELLSRFPLAIDLAAADIREVEQILYPLGLYRKRARQLVGCAQVLVREYDGEVPSRVDKLIALPYVGRYAANAVMCFGFNKKHAVIDSNVARVWQRVFSLPLPPKRLSSADDLWRFAKRLLPDRGCKRFNWAILDLGGAVCLPRHPKCHVCPIMAVCYAHAIGTCGCTPRSPP
jgi:A/G-specific adenine glycosylase